MTSAPSSICDNIIVGTEEDEEDILSMRNMFDSPPKRATNSDPTADDDSTRAFEECANAVKRDIENYLDPSISVPPSTEPLQW
eukprot:CAMPEP_0118677864 /NCGR_PEP_ID=MMETSP0800-20121206/2874_1 /TAXON_ID=210618 ORGANISM="Striatella unipunctata, Strain CCMP2910" /NCGR_SAMPLE_ID=MMETSP0800 /ASSEMBLY_ACC=CAM_ASM_000638 /LENGTH=82 /DNA_ID=CAMNT_0006573605 /DNA_START=327 /DNA_END=572 /DNA_ORIENTATION=-